MSSIDPGDDLRELARAVRFHCEDVCEFGLHVLDDYIGRPHPTALLNAANLFALAGRRVRALHDQIHGNGTVLSLAEPGVAEGGRARGADPPSGLNACPSAESAPSYSSRA